LCLVRLVLVEVRLAHSPLPCPTPSADDFPLLLHLAAVLEVAVVLAASCMVAAPWVVLAAGLAALGMASSASASAWVASSASA